MGTMFCSNEGFTIIVRKGIKRPYIFIVDKIARNRKKNDLYNFLKPSTGINTTDTLPEEV